MGLFSKDIKNMSDLHLHVLQDIYYAENQIKKALPDMIEKAKNREANEASLCLYLSRYIRSSRTQSVRARKI